MSLTLDKMRYSLEPNYRKYVQGQGFMSFAKNIGNKYGRKILDKSMDASKDFAKIEATGEMIGNKVADRITKSSRNKAQKEDNRIMEETIEIYIPPEKREQIIRYLKLF